MKNTILREALLFNATAILGPVFFLGGAGYLLDRYFDTNKMFLFFAIGFAFILTNVLMFRKVMKFIKVSNVYIKEADDKEAREKAEAEKEENEAEE